MKELTTFALKTTMLMVSAVLIIASGVGLAILMVKGL